MDEAIDNLREAVALYYEDDQVPSFSQTYVTTLEVAGRPGLTLEQLVRYI